MVKTYQEVYPEPPIIKSSEFIASQVSKILTLEYFEAEPAEMLPSVFSHHHIVINLKETPYRAENWRDGTHRDFWLNKDEIIVTPAGMKSGWKWHDKSKVIIITLLPMEIELFAKEELNITLDAVQLKDIPQFVDADICNAALMLKEAIDESIASKLIFESLARVFLVKFIQKYGVERTSDAGSAQGFTSSHYKKVIDYVSQHFASNISLESMADVACLSPYHFSRLFKKTLGLSPHQYVLHYRIEQASKMLVDKSRSILDVAISCGFSDQAHFTRVFKKITQTTPKQFRLSN